MLSNSETEAWQSGHCFRFQIRGNDVEWPCRRESAPVGVASGTARIDCSGQWTNGDAYFGGRSTDSTCVLRDLTSREEDLSKPKEQAFFRHASPVKQWGRGHSSAFLSAASGKSVFFCFILQWGKSLDLIG